MSEVQVGVGSATPGGIRGEDTVYLSSMRAVRSCTSPLANSYDYAAAIKETRLLWEKYDEMKRQALFIRSSPQFRKTDWIGDSNSGIPGVALDGSAAFATYLRNLDSGTGFVIVRQANSTST